jgi:oligopeptide transport system ATP-binding protein
LLNPPVGCPFCTRCEYCMEICKDMPPQTYELSKEHETCCWLQHEYAPDTDMRRKVTEKGEV